jgi:hypothetical protein
MSDVEIAMIPFLDLSVPLVELDLIVDAASLDFSRVIFLDFDGVLHPEDCAQRDNFCFLPNFCEALGAADPGGKTPIVISSLWRHHCTLRQLRGYFPVDIAPRIAGVTPYMSAHEVERVKDWSRYGGDQSRIRHRQREIIMWMNAHAPQGNWLAIDDRESYFHKDTPHLFLVPKLVYQGDSGITERQKEALTQRLRRFLG